MSRPLTYPWPELARDPEARALERSSAEEEEARRAYLRIYQSGRRWCTRHRPDLKPVVTRTAGGFEYSLTKRSSR